MDGFIANLPGAWTKSGSQTTTCAEAILWSYVFLPYLLDPRALSEQNPEPGWKDHGCTPGASSGNERRGPWRGTVSTFEAALLQLLEFHNSKRVVLGRE